MKIAGLGTFVIMFMFFIITLLILIASITLLVIGITGKGKRTGCTIAGGILLGLFFLFVIVVIVLCFLGFSAAMFARVLPNQL